jgi:hypothetical protein
MLTGSRNVAKPRIATAVLTRGYTLRSFLSYRFIIARNRSILRILVAQRRGVKIDHFVFHEGNIGILGRVAIGVASWPLRLRFVNLRKFFDKFAQGTTSKNLERCPETYLSSQFSVKYRAMCAFWIDEFLTYLGDYDVVFRVDEDCVLRSLDFESVLSPMIEGAVDYCAGMAFGFDAPDVTRGFEDFCTEWHEEHPSTRIPVFSVNPYTNLFLLRPQAVKSIPEALDFLQHVRSSGCVLKNRWGDHVVWGALLSMYGDTLNSDFAAKVSYFHGSHGALVSQE